MAGQVSVPACITGYMTMGVSVHGGLCREGSLSRGFSVKGVSFQRGLCPGGVSVWGVSVWGVSVLLM